jgi:hypothetical protein
MKFIFSILSVLYFSSSEVKADMPNCFSDICLGDVESDSGLRAKGFDSYDGSVNFCNITSVYKDSQNGENFLTLWILTEDITSRLNGVPTLYSKGTVVQLEREIFYEHTQGILPGQPSKKKEYRDLAVRNAKRTLDDLNRAIFVKYGDAVDYDDHPDFVHLKYSDGKELITTSYDLQNILLRETILVPNIISDLSEIAISCAESDAKDRARSVIPD